MTWEVFKSIEELRPSPYTPLGVECPKCGKLIWRNNQIVLTTNPPKYEYVCLECGWIGYK